MQRQWETTQRQLKDSEASTSAHLIIEDFNPTLTMAPGQSMLIRGSLKVSNDGNSVASEIYFVQEFVGSRLPLHPLPELTPTPVPNGPSLGIGKSIEVPVGMQIGQWDAVEKGGWFVGFWIAVSYRNIFGEPEITPACIVPEHAP